MLRKNLGWALFIVCALFLQQIAFPQATFGSILGTVADNSRASIPNATVVVKNQGTNVAKTMKSDARGNYEILSLVPGLYSVTVEANGFATYTAKDLEVGAMRALRVDARLTIGTLETTVIVTGGAPAIETESATVSSVRTLRELRDNPMNLRTLQGLTGDSGAWALVHVTPTGIGNASRMSMGGSRASMSDVNVDGISTRHPLFGQIQPLLPSLDAMQEARVEYVNNKAEFSEMANLSIVTRSGENQFHGRLGWDVGNKIFNTRRVFTTANAKANRNDLSGTFSGPIVKNKVFFLGIFEGQLNRMETFVNPSVPTAKMRQGDFSELLALSTPVVVKNPFGNDQPFPNNTIPQNLRYAGSTAYQNSIYPLPNYGAPSSFVANYYQGSVPHKFSQRHFTGRVDYYIAPRHMLYGRVTAQRSDTPFLEGWLGMPADEPGYRNQIRNDRNVALSYTWTASPTVINELKAGYSRDYNPREGPRDGMELVALLGIQGLPPQVATFRNLPGISISGFNALTQSAGSGPEGDVLQFTDQVSWIRGRHTLKMGVDFAPQHANTRPGPNYGSYSFTNRFTGFAYSDYLMGLPAGTSRSFASIPVTNSYYFLNGFVQDDFKISPRLTLSYGLRYEYGSPVVDRFNLVYNFDTQTGSQVVSDQEVLKKMVPIFPKEMPILTADQAGFPARSLRQSDRNNLLPRFGFAWRVGGDNRSVIRGGYGVFNDSLTAQHFQVLYFGGPFTGGESFTNSITNGVPLLTLQYPFLDRGSPSMTVGNLSVYGIAPNLKNPTAQQWSLTLEREVVAKLGVRASYIGTKSTGALYLRNINQPVASLIPFTQSRRPYPKYSGITIQENGGSSFYNALSLEVERKWSNGFSFQGSWTWNKNLSNVDEFAGTAESGALIENTYDRQREWSNVSAFPRHRFFTNLMWQLPFGNRKQFMNRKGVLDWVLGGWQLNVNYQAQTGTFFTPSFSGSDPSNTNTFGGLPDRIADGNLPKDQRTILRWFDASAFAPPPKGRFGNSGKNILIGPGRHTMCGGLIKEFHVNDRIVMRAQASFSNLMNHPNVAAPAANISQPTAVGRITAVNAPDYSMSDRRIGLLGLRLIF